MAAFASTQMTELEQSDTTVYDDMHDAQDGVCKALAGQEQAKL